MADPVFPPDEDNPFAQFGPRPVGALNMTPGPAQLSPATDDTDNPFAQFGPRPAGLQGGGSSALGTLGRSGLRSVIPSAAGLAGAGEGAAGGAAAGGALGELAFPLGGGVPGAAIGGIIGGLGGMFAGSYAGEKAQSYGLSKLPESWVEALGQDDRQQRLDQEQHPYASFLGGLVPYAVTMDPFGGAKKLVEKVGPNATALERIMANPLTARVFGGGLMGGMELGQEYAEGDVNWNKVAIATGFGLIFNHPNEIGKFIEGAGPRAFGHRTAAEFTKHYEDIRDQARAETLRAADRARPPRDEARFPLAPEWEERGDLFRGEHDYGLDGLYDALTEPRHEDQDILGAEAPAFYGPDKRFKPTLIDAWASNIAGPGTTEATSRGSELRAPDVEKAAQEAKAEEAATIGPRQTPNVATEARAAHPEAFNEYDALISQRNALAKSIEDTPSPQLTEQLKAVDAQIAEAAPEITAAHRRAAEAKGGETIAPTPAPPVPAPANPVDLQTIVDDVKAKFMAAGRPEAEAEALGHQVATFMQFRAEAFEGQRGTALDFYNGEGAFVRSADGKTRKVGGTRSGQKKAAPKPAPAPPTPKPVEPPAPALKTESEKPAEPAPEPAPVSLPDRIRAAMREAGGGEWNKRVPLTAIRAALPDVPRAELDAALADMHVKDGFHLSGSDNPRELTPEMKDAGLVYKGEPMQFAWQTREPGTPAAAPRAAPEPVAPPRAPEPAPAPVPEKPVYGAGNTFTTLDDYQKIQAQIRQKLKDARSQLNSGFDPELALLGMRAAAFHLEAGSRRFAEFAALVARDFEASIRELAPYLSGWYNGGRDFMEGHGLDVSGLDDPNTVRAELTRMLAEDAGTAAPKDTIEPPPEPEPEPEPARDPRASFIAAIKEKLAGDEKPFKSIIEARALAREHGLEIPEGASANKTIDELIERAVVESAREIVARDLEAGATPQETFAKIVKLYDNQPNLSTRTSTSVAEQAYSTPAPLAYVASRLAGIDHDTYVLEPTAGNGMLLMEADPRKARVNELNAARANSLKEQGFHPSRADGAEESTFADSAGKMDVVIANPPFGTVREGGETKVFHVGDYKTTQIDQAIALNALKTMKADGRAVLIVGGVMAESPAERVKAYQGQSKRKFYYNLLQNYRVTDVFTVSGDLYTKQGAGFPVDVIVIDGKGRSTRDYLTKTPPTILKTWDEVAGKLDGLQQGNAGEIRPTGEDSQPSPGAAPQEPAPESGNGVGGASPSGGGPVPELPRPGTDAGAVGGTRDSPEPGYEGPQPPVAGGAGHPPGEGGELRGINSEPHTERGRTVGLSEESQTPYEPASKAGVKLNTLLPANLRDATNGALDRLEFEKGGVDNYVAEALGRDVGELGKYFSAEQIDAIALGISNIEKGEGFIIGDQTGIGKGRVVAAMLTYAKRKGMVPLFVTEKPDLYGDMWRDLHDIGWHEQLGREINMVMTNSDTAVPLDDEALEWCADRDEAKANGQKIPPVRGTFSKAQKKEAATAHMRAIVAGTESPDVVFTTYNQMQSVKGGETERRNFLRAVSPRAFLIMDEAHNAGGVAVKEGEERKQEGPPARSEVFREAVAKARSVMYSSATYAKNPSVMTLYSKTDMAKAVDDVKQLPALIARGGVPLQQVVASMLAKAGQYLRRERSWQGVTYDHETVPVSEKGYSEFSSGLRSVFVFDKALEEERKKLAEQIAGEMGGGTARDSGVGEASASTTSFASVMHNVINQMVMATKAEKAGERAVEALKAGEKPVLALSKTNASFIHDAAELADVKIGDVFDISFPDILKRYLERTRRVTLKSGEGDKVRVMIPLDSMSPEMRAMYKAAESALAKIEMGDLPVSPIDAMRNVIQKAGYTVREVTGRDEMLDYSGAKPVMVKRPASEMGSSGKKVSVKAFNDGKLDAIILNQSGSTGISLHASSKFADQRRRRMIIAEADPNIDTHMQMLGRVHRTGQVSAPAYTHLSADIPAEARPTAILMRKMASLTANTTGSAKSNLTADAVDFLNKYGDRVVRSVLQDDLETWSRLGSPALGDADGPPIPGVAAKVTGRLTLLEPKAQEAFLKKIADRYKQFITELDATGTNDLEAKSLDLRARVLSSQVLKAESGPSPFQGAVNLEKVSMKSQGRAMSPSDVVGHIADALKTAVPAGEFPEQMAELATQGRKKHVALVERIRVATAERLRDEFAALKEPEAKEKAKDNLNKSFVRWRMLAERAYPGARMTLDLDGEKVPAIVIGFDQREDAKNPVAASSWEVTLALPDGRRSLGLPLSRVVHVEEGDIASGRIEISPSDVTHETFADMFSKAQKEGREERYMVSGNILAGFGKTSGSGQIINHTMEDSSVRPAILMARNFNAKNFMDTRAVRLLNGEHVLNFLDATKEALQAKGGDLSIAKAKRGYGYDFAIASGGGGKKYYTDRAVRDVWDQWERRGGLMRANVSEATAKRLIDALMDVGAEFETRKHQELAESLMEPSDGGTQFQRSNASKYGKISFLHQGLHSLITLFEHANASTALHELGHDFLEMLKRDAAHPLAPQKMRDMWAVAKRELGIAADNVISDKAHEKWADGHMRFFYEGTAPTRGLDRLFKAFREWLLPLYEKMKGLQTPISPGLRSVFEYIYTTRDRDTVIAPHPERPAEIHDLHAAEAEDSHPLDADGKAARIEAERPHFDDANPPREIANEIAEAQAEIEAAGSDADAGGETGGGHGGRGKVEHGGEQAGHEPTGVGLGGAGGPERAGGNAAATEGGGPAGGEPRPAAGRSEPDGPLRDVPLASRPVPLISDGESPFLDKAGNIRRDTINRPDDIWAAIKARSEANGDFRDARRDPTSWEQSGALARAAGREGAQQLVDNWTRGQAFSAHQIEGLINFLEDQATHVGKLARLADMSDEGVLNFATEQARLDMVIKTVMGATAEAGRALNIFRKMQSRGLDEAMIAATGRTLYQKQQEMKMMAAYETPEAIAYLTGATSKHSYGRMLLEYWINGLISGPATHTTYIVGNALLSAEKGFLETPVAAALGALRGPMGRDKNNVIHFGEMRARLAGLRAGFAPALEAAGRSASTGLTGRLPGQDKLRALPFQGDQDLPLAGSMLNEGATMADVKAAWHGVARGMLDGFVSIGKILSVATPAGERTAAPLYSPLGANPDVRLRGGVLPTGQLARLPSRAVAVIHTFFRGVNYSMEKAALTYRMAANEGYTGDLLAHRMSELRLDTPDAIMTAAAKGSTDLTLMGPAGELVRKISQVTNWAPNIPGLGETPILKFVDPFVHIAANVIDQSIVQRTPAGLLSSEIRADLSGKNGAAAQDMAQARMIVGSAMALGFGALAANGYVSGSGPTDRNQAAMWRLAGNQPHSVRIGDVWYQMNRLGPLGMLLSISADLYDVAHLASEGDILAAGAMMHHAIVQNILDESFMRGPADLIQAVEDPGRYGERYLQNFASSFVPYSVAMAQMDRASDPYTRQARTVMDAIRQKIPGLSETLLPRRDIWGEPMPNKDALAAAGVTAIYEQRVSRDPVNIAMLQLGIGFSPVERTIRNVKLTDEQYDDFARIAGRIAKQRLDVMVASPDWQRWPVGVRVDVAKVQVEKSRETARNLIFMKHPSILAAATRQKAQKFGAAQ